MKLRNNLVKIIKTDSGMFVLLILLAAGTRWFAFRGWKAVPFAIIDEILLVWALKDFMIGDWTSIAFPITRFVASFAFMPFLGTYFTYQWFAGHLTGTQGIVDSFFHYTSNATDFISVWVWLPRLVSWLSMVLSIPIQFLLVKRLVGSGTIAVLACLLLNLSFTHLRLSLFHLGSGVHIGLPLFQLACLVLITYVRMPTIKRLICFAILLGATLLTWLPNGCVLIALAVFGVVRTGMSGDQWLWGKILRRLIVTVALTTAVVVILNPLIYLAPSTIVREFYYGVGEWAPRGEWDLGVHFAYMSRVVFDEIIGPEITLLVGAAIVVMIVRKTRVSTVSVSGSLIAFFCFLAMAYLSEMSYESELVAMLVPASILAAWFLIYFFEVLTQTRINSIISGATILGMFVASQLRPMQDWLGIYRAAQVEGTRAAARNWIHENIKAGANILLAPYPYTAPLIKSIQQLEAEAPDAQLTRWRVGTALGSALSPTYSLLTENETAWTEGLDPDYYVRTSFAQLPVKCSWEGIWAYLLCPYDPLRGSMPHFSQINQIPYYPPDAEMMLLREFNPVCQRSRNQNVYINYRTSVLRNNIRNLCSLGPLIQVYQLSMSRD